MLNTKKFIHFIFLSGKKNLNPNTEYTFSSLYSKNGDFYFNNNLLFKPNISFKEIYDLKFRIKTKHLFLFTIYIVSSKLSKITNIFHFKFNLIIKKQKKFTILRAPCNHKTSKEQFGINNYSGKLTGLFVFILNKFYHNYIMSFFLLERNQGVISIKYNIRKNAT
jgi:hypothetical protein